ncbi:MAG: hypothetical protein JWO90_2912, partial [Solirubrobacterales bacterium]|nr:hypothetical protein [Solirubrobacterales bacterium]
MPGTPPTIAGVRRARTLAAVVPTLPVAAAASASAAPAGRGSWNEADQAAGARTRVLPPLVDGRLHGERVLAGG